MAQSEKAQAFQSDIMNKITQTVIDGIAAGTAPWQMPWETRGTMVRPQNLATHKDYRGLNAMYLQMLGMSYGCDYWLGFGQAKKLGGQVIKGSKATYILAPMTIKDKTKTNADGSPRFFIAGFKIVKIFNATEFTGIEGKIPQPEILDEPRKLDAHMLDEFMASTGAEIKHGGDRAFYQPGNDFVQLPEMDQFKSAGGYYGTALHELVHWTGHKSRKNRLGDKNKRGYAFEELIAELGAYYASERLGCPNEAENHTSYLESWLKALQSDTKYLWDAASKAQAAADWLIDHAGKEESKAA
jgi:antirestriction protein ArdC